MKVKKISVANVDVSALPRLLDEERIGFQSIDHANWKAYPYKPKAAFRIAHTENAILLHFNVKETSVRARYNRDNDTVRADSCVEFFSIPAADGIYYNFECNCIGTIRVGAGKGCTNREYAPQEIITEVQRWSSLGNKPFPERMEKTSWDVALIIPYTVFFKHKITSLNGKMVKANFYKCGDELQTPHFLSWSPIETPRPDFHSPYFFGTLAFE